MIEAFKYRLPVSYFLKIQGLDLILADGANVAGSSQEFCPAMRIRDQAIGHSVQPLSVVGQGRALDIMLDADVLQASGFLDDYFSTPGVLATLDTDEITATTTSFPLKVDATGFPTGGGTAYWGIEKLVYGSATSVSSGAQTLNSVTRDSTGSAFNFAQVSPRGLSGQWACVSDRPLIWRGRLVELWGVATTPEGELLGTPFSTSGMTSGASRLWVGYVSEQPTISTTGILLRCLPAERLIEKDYGHQLKWATAWKKNPNYGNWVEWLYWPQGGRLRLRIIKMDGTLFTSEVEPVDTFHGSTISENNKKRIITPIDAWDYCISQWETDLSSSTTDAISIHYHFIKSNGSGGPGVQLVVATDGTGTDLLKACHVDAVGSAAAQSVAVAAERGQAVQSEDGPGEHVKQEYNAPLMATAAHTGGFPVQDPISSADAIWAGVPVAGQSTAWRQSALAGYDHEFFAKIETVIAWNTITGSDASYWLRLDPESGTDEFAGAMLTQPITDVSDISQALLIQGAADSDGAKALTLGSLWLQLLTTSGSGSKSSTYDIHPHGWGAGIPIDWIKFAAGDFGEFSALTEFKAFDRLDAPAMFVDALAEQRAFAQTFVNQIARVDAVPMSQPTEAETAISIATTDLLADPVAAGVLSPPPNIVTFSFANSSLPSIVQRDLLRMQSEGETNSLELTVPAQWYYDDQDTQNGGITRLGAVAASILRGPFMGHVYLFTLALPSDYWGEINVGDALTVTGEHYAWVSLAPSGTPGHRQTSIRGRVLSVEIPLNGSGMEISVAVWSNATPQIYCPDSAFTVSSLTITLPAGRVGWFWDGDRDDVTFYLPGDEANKLEEKEMQSSTGNDIVFSSLPSWVGDSGVRITFAKTATASDRQKLFAHCDDGGILL